MTLEQHSSKHIAHAHDYFFRTSMADLRVAREFLMVHLPDEIREVIDLEKLELQPRSYIDDVGNESTVDILYKTMISGHEAYLYLLLEHQSKPDELMPFRMLKYTCNVIDQYLKNTNKKLLPLVYPMVIYHAKRPYPYSTDINHIVDAPKALVDLYFLKPFQLIDLGRIEDEVLKQHAWAGAMGFVLKHIHTRDLLLHLENISATLRLLAQSGGRDYVSVVLQYLLQRGELPDKEAFLKIIDTQISSEVGEEIMSLAEQLREEGMREGMYKGKLEGKLEIAKRLLAQGKKIIFIADITGLPVHKIQELQEKP